MNKVQQGDVVLKRIDSIPNGAVKVDSEHRGYTVAYGEATGHAHIIQDTQGVELYELDKVLYVKALRDADLKHLKPNDLQAEHNTVPIPSGLWKIGIVREYDPFTEEIRNVRD